MRKKGWIIIKKNIFVIIITVLSLVVINYTFRNSLLTPVSVKTVSPVQCNLATSIKSKGRFIENNVKAIYLPLGYEIWDIDVKAGETVKKDSVLMKYKKTTSDVVLSVPEIPIEIEDTQSITTEDILSVFQNRSLPQTDISAKEAIRIEEKEEEGEIKSPITGMITKVNYQEGDTVNPAKSVITISDFGDMMIKTEISESLIQDIKIGQRVSITGEALRNISLYGVVTEISPTAKQTLSLTYPETVIEVFIKPEGDTSLIRPGISLELSIITENKENVLTIPYEAITQDENNYEVVYVVNDGKLFKRFIVTGIESDESVEVIEGIKENDQIVINPTDNLKDLQRVIVSE